MKPTVATLPQGWFTSYINGHVRVITAPNKGHVTINYEHGRIALGYRTPTPWTERTKPLGRGQTRELEERAIEMLDAQPWIRSPNVNPL